MGIILDLLYPRKCVGCGKTGNYICSQCRKSIFTNEINKNRLGIFKYHGNIRKLIRLIKFEMVTDSIDELTDLMKEELNKNFFNLVSYWQKNKTTIVPVPLYWTRENWRGFNQSKEIGEMLAEKLDLKFDNNLLERIKKGKIQSLLKTNQEKAENVKNAFKIVGKIPKNIIIFDDVYTSGKTTGQIIKILPKKTNYFVLTVASGS
jgi:ComF family protein